MASTNPYANPLGGIRVFDNELLGDPYEDWSQVRSPSRAERRRRQGHEQRIVTRYRANGTFLHDKIHNAIFCHPADRIRLEAKMREAARG